MGLPEGPHAREPGFPLNDRLAAVRGGRPRAGPLAGLGRPVIRHLDAAPGNPLTAIELDDYFLDLVKIPSLSKNEKGVADYIKKFLGDVKIIIILRNPIERAFSAYMHLVRDNREFLTLEEALDQEENRKRQNWEFIWYYKDVGFYYNQVKAYLESYSKVKIYLFDDLKRNPLDLVQDIYRFLEVDDLFVPSNIGEKFNISGVPKNKLINEFLTRPNPLKSAIKPLFKLFLSEHNIQRLYNELLQRNLKKPQMKPKTREYLKNLYKKDILKLQDLINRDLTHWLSS